jgi:hypothetical protein
MPDSAGNCILLFDSIHHVLAAERAFLQRSYEPFPRKVVITLRRDDNQSVGSPVPSATSFVTRHSPGIASRALYR